MDTRIRALKKEDVPAVAMLESACFSAPWPEEQIEYERTGNPCAKVLVAVSKWRRPNGIKELRQHYSNAWWRFAERKKTRSNSLRWKYGHRMKRPIRYIKNSDGKMS